MLVALLRLVFLLCLVPVLCLVLLLRPVLMLRLILLLRLVPVLRLLRLIPRLRLIPGVSLGSRLSLVSGSRRSEPTARYVREFADRMHGISPAALRAYRSYLAISHRIIVLSRLPGGKPQLAERSLS